MSQKGKARAKRTEAKQEKQAKKVVNGIFITLIVVALLMSIIFSIAYA